jgi:hypothetical protein
VERSISDNDCHKVPDDTEIPGQDSPSDIVDVPADPRILRAHPPHSSYDLSAFTKPVNPATRSRQFAHLYGQQLWTVVNQLSTWELFQEIPSVFTNLDVMLMYLVEEEQVRTGYQMPDVRDAATAPLSIAMAKQGFAWREYLAPSKEGPFTSKLKRLTATADVVLEALSNSAPSALLVSDQASSVAKIAIRMPGPIGETFRIINQPFTERRVLDRTIKWKHCPPPCLEARMELYHDQVNRKRLHTLWWARFRVLYPQLLYWKPGQKIFDVNPGVLDPGNPIQGCHPPFWNTLFSRSYVHSRKKAPVIKTGIKVFCRIDQRFEKWSSSSIKDAQLAAGFFSSEAWAGLMFETATDDYWRQLQGISRSHRLRLVRVTDVDSASHLCGCGIAGCYGLFCVIWESNTDNIDRRPCHKRFKTDPADDDGCLCEPGKAVPCIPGRAHMSETELRDNFYDILDENLRKPSPSQPAALSSCPICGYEPVTLTSLSDCLDIDNINKFVQHMNLRHNCDMAKLTREH